MERNACNETQADWYLITRSVVLQYQIYSCDKINWNEAGEVKVKLFLFTS
jgi:hypothetical protein